MLIHQAFASGNEAGGTRHWELGTRLPRYGHRLTVVASRVSYLTGAAAPGTATHARMQPQHEGEVEVRRVTALNVHHRGFIWRVLAFVWFALASAAVAIRLPDVDLVMGTSPPIFQALSAWLVATLRRKPFLLEIRDLWPEFAIDMGVLRHPLLIFLARSLERFLYRHADLIVVNSPAYRDSLVDKGIPNSRIRFLPNGVDVSMFDPRATGSDIRKRYALGEQFLVVYAGAHGMANDLQRVLEAADRLRTYPDIHFLFVGDGKERGTLEAVARDRGLQNVTFAGALPKDAMPEVLAAADVCVATLMNIPMFATTYPNKVFDYMAAGRPTLLGIDGVIRTVIEQAEGGLYVPPGDAVALADAIIVLYDDRARAQRMGEQARRYVEAHFDRAAQAATFATILNELQG